MNRFDLEQHIMKTWGLVDDMKDLAIQIESREMTPHLVINILNGLAELYQGRFEVLFDEFEAMIQRELDYKLEK